ncbi:MAG TPA: trehalose-phosphatase [Stellaceae bacterium]|nr:trehalose-phosphatase [Stellaceae bacterium]
MALTMPLADTAAGAQGRPPLIAAGNSLFLDFDGTLVELAPTPAEVHVPASLPTLLAGLATRLDGAVAVVSGRSLADLAPLLAPFAGALVGQHGHEIRHADGRVVHAAADGAVAAGRRALLPFAGRHRGIMLEDKGGTIALHYRGAPQLAEDCRSAAREATAASAGGLRTIDGNQVIELVPREVGKGGAITTLAAQPPFRGRVPVFVGDDATDEDGFAALAALGGISVKVGGGATAARYRLADVAAVWNWLGRSK